MATNGNDTIFFQGTLGQLTMALVNPYSGEILFIDDEKNINIASYDGLNGNDTMLLTNLGDALFLTDNMGVQVVKNIESFIAGDGGDVINLAHQTIVYNNTLMSGGEGHDILWGNAGVDQIFGSGGNDHIDGGPGHDSLFGNNDNDRVNGGAGNDRVDGGLGDDILFGGNDVPPVVLDKEFSDSVIFPHLLEGVNIVDLVPPGTPALGYEQGNMTVNFAASATLTFREGFAGYNNTLGVYRIAADGTIEAAKVLWGNTKDAGLGVAHEIDLPVGAEGGDFGFFIIADGERVNNHYNGLDITGDGVVRFVYDYGLGTERAATVHDNGNRVSMVYDDGSTMLVLGGPHYHTTERGGSTAINWDGQSHMVSGLVDVGQQDVLRIGFEDLPNLGDADYEDVFFDFNINEVIIQGATENGNDSLIGGAGDDLLYGQNGNDILVIGDGLDHAYGDNGSDQFVYDIFDALVDTIHDFEVGMGKDVLNITDILEGYDPLSDAIADFVQIDSQNGDTYVNINADGAGNDFTQMAVLTGVDTTLADLINNGNLVANQSVVV